MKSSPNGVGAAILAAIAVTGFCAQAEAVPSDAHFRSPYLVLNAEASPSAPRPFALGDVNNDQAVDLVLAGGPTSSSVRVYLGDGYGNFLAPLRPNGWMASDSIWNPVLADLNGDHRLDLLFISSSNQVSVQLGHGDGTFDAPIVTITPSEVRSLTVGDMSEDGLPDLVVGWRGFNVLLGDGSGHFTSSAGISSFNSTDQSVLTDMNGDGHLDVVVTQNVYFLGDGHGGLGAECGAGAGGWGGSVAVTDLDHDGNKDIVSANDAGLRLRYSSPGGVFQATRDTSYYKNYVRSLVARDLDGDGRDEIVVGSYDIQVYSVDARGRLQLSQTLPTPTPDALASVDAADVNGDGRLDLVAASPGVSANPGLTAVYLADRAGVFASAPSRKLFTRTGRIVSGRFSDPTRLSVAVLLPEEDSLVVVGATRDGSPAVESGVRVHDGAIASGDLDRDGLDDLVVADETNAVVTVLRNRPDRTWERTEIAGVPFMRWIGLADLNQDGRLDIVTRNAATGLVYAFPADESGFQAPLFVADPQTAGAYATCQDVDNDGDPDLILNSYIGSFWPFSGSAGFTFVARPFFFGSGEVGGICLADVTHDGWLDVLTSGPESGFVPTHGLPWSYSGGGHLAGRATAIAPDDFDGDGYADFVKTSPEKAVVAAWRMYPPYGFDLEPWSYGFGFSNLDQCLLTDVTGDGFADLVATEPGSGIVWIAPRVPYATTGVAPVSPTSRGAVTFVGSAPNPLRSTAALQFRLQADARVKITIMDPRGRIVRGFPERLAPAGELRETWDGLSDEGVRVTPGMYFARVRSEHGSASGKLIVL